MTVGGRNWRLHFVPTLEYLNARQSWGLWLVLASGLALTCLLGTGLLIITGHTAAVEAIVTARTRELVQSKETIRASLEEKETLLREVHHRVKNNMQVISSILHLQSEHIRDPEDRAIFDECQNRVRSMAMVHEKLYRSPNLSSIDFGEHIRELAAMLSHFYGQTARHTRLEVKAEAVGLNIDTAIPLGLILNELISNALKHAFPGGRPGTILVSLDFQPSGKLVLAVQDDGVGLPDGFDLDNTRSLGLKMIRDLTRQVGGTLILFRNNGTTFEISLPAPVVAGPEE